MLALLAFEFAISLISPLAGAWLRTHDIPLKNGVFFPWEGVFWLLGVISGSLSFAWIWRRMFKRHYATNS